MSDKTKPYLKEFEIRWSDLDANRHLANASYINYMSQTRMDYFEQHDFGLAKMTEHHIAPVVFYEHIHYFREIMPGKPIFVSLLVKGLSKDGMFFEFEHGFYNQKGHQHAVADLMGGFIDFTTRKLTPLQDGLMDQFLDHLPKSDDFRWLSKEDTRKHQRFPKALTF